jgi:hypothetical protein
MMGALGLGMKSRFGLDPNEQCIKNMVLKSIPTIW